MKELVSIIIPVHNSSKYLKNCLESVINQTYENIEIICIENGSTDNSLEIINNYKDKIKIIILEKASLSLARNKGIEKSNGKYLTFLDSDDTIEHNFIEELITNLEKNNSDLSICNIKETNENTGKVHYSNCYPNDVIYKEEILSNLDKFNHGPTNKLFKKEIIKNNDIAFPIKLKYEDIVFVIKYLVNCNKISKVNKYLYNYNIHDKSEQTTINNKIFDIFEIMDLCLSITNKENIENLYVNILTTYSLKMRNVKDKKIRNKFIDKAYEKLNTNFPKWKKSDYLKNRNILKRIIQKNKNLVKIYTSIYSKSLK